MLMNRESSLICIDPIYYLFAAAVHAQNTAGIEIDSRKIPLPARRSQIPGIHSEHYRRHFPYTANQFDNIVMAELPEGEMQLETLLQNILDYHLQVAVAGRKCRSNQRGQDQYIRLHVDADRWSIARVLIYQPATGNYTSTDVKVFTMECRQGPLELKWGFGLRDHALHWWSL